VVRDRRDFGDMGGATAAVDLLADEMREVWTAREIRTFDAIIEKPRTLVLARLLLELVIHALLVEEKRRGRWCQQGGISRLIWGS
jgi:hypothetical protein